MSYNTPAPEPDRGNTETSADPVLAPVPGRSLLSTAGEQPERADAARNRRLLLDAAQQLVREYGVDGLTMDALARRAGVGKGTVFRRFGNRTGLMLALLDHSERESQEAFIFGPPPLGPGAPPVERLVAFGRARLLNIEVEGELYRAAETGPPEERYSAPPYNLIKNHVSLLLREAGTTGEIPLLTDTLLATLSAALVLHQTRTLGYNREQIGDNWEAVVRRVVLPATPVE